MATKRVKPTRVKPERAKPKYGSAAEYIPPRPTLAKLRASAAGCQACDLWLSGTQTVFGEGSTQARLMIVGEQPGDQEDRSGHPFVGPSGALLDAALAAVGIDREQVYVTNAVKHFKWERAATGGRRIHKKPNTGEITACQPWLRSEIAVVKPDVLLCLGATAAQSLLGKQFRITRDRGKPITAENLPLVFTTVHPSAVLRSPDPESRKRAEREFVADIKRVAEQLGRGA